MVSEADTRKNNPGTSATLEEAWTMFGWWSAARRRHLLKQPEPTRFREALAHGIWQWQYLPDDAVEAATRWTRIFLAEKYWEGCEGLELNNYQKTVIAGQASLMSLAYPDWFVDGCKTLLIYPEDYVAEGVTHMVNGQTGIHGRQARSGQTSYRGPVILNWRAVASAGLGPNDGHSLTVHELAHQMDFDNGPMVDGIPPLPPGVDADRWQTDFNIQFAELQHLSDSGFPCLVDDYGLTSASEFFAVSSELYFQLPHQLAQMHAELFELLLIFYQRDFREWLPAYS